MDTTILNAPEMVQGKKVVRITVDGKVQVFLDNGNGDLTSYDPTEMERTVEWRDEKTGKMKSRETGKRLHKISTGNLLGVHTYITDKGENKVAIIKWRKYSGGRWGQPQRCDFPVADGGLFDTMLQQLRELNVLEV